MSLESGVTYIENLVSTNPESTDAIAEGDDHIRNIKTAVQGSFPSLGAAAVTKTAAEINDLAAATNGTLTSPTINGADGYGLVILDTPEILDSIEAAEKGSWFDEVSDSWSNNTLTTANAVKAIIKCTAAFSATPNSWVAYCRRNGSSDSGTVTIFGGGEGINGYGTTVVNLDGSSLFEWRVDGTFGVGDGSVSLTLVGYYK